MRLHHVSHDPAYGRLKKHLIASTGLVFYANRDRPLGALIGERLAKLCLPNCASYAALVPDGAAGGVREWL